MAKTKKVSITDIAKDLHVAPSTVSRALHDEPGVSEDVRDQIREYARAKGYFLPKRKTNSKTGRQNIVSMIVGDIRNPFYADIVFAAQTELSKHGYLLTAFNSQYNQAEEAFYLNISENFNFAGVIPVTVMSEDFGEVLSKLSIPVVLCNRMINSYDCDVVVLDNFEAGYIATRHLIELGHREIGFLAGQYWSSTSGQRYNGYLSAMENYKVPVNPKYFIQGDLTLQTAYELAKEFVRKTDVLPTAMVISNDVAAHGFMSYCVQAGIKIPEQMSVISFDNILFSDAGTVPLTSIDAHATEMGVTAARLLMERINNPNKVKERIILRPELVQRKSTARPRRK